MLIEILEIENIVSGTLGVSFGEKYEADSSRFVFLYQSLIPYYPAAALERGIDTGGEKRKFKVWVAWFPGGKSILVAVSPGNISFPICPHNAITLLCKIKN